MTHVLLFCVSEEAKAVRYSTLPLCRYITLTVKTSFVRDVLNSDIYGGNARAQGTPGGFYLVESREGPPDGQRLREQLQEDETFETDFIGATPEECQRWADEWSRHDRSTYGRILAIVDARSAKDGTILMQNYVQPPAGTGYFIFGGYGILPPETNVWYDFRVDYYQAGKVVDALHYVAPDVTWPFWYGNKERFTDEDGVFDVQECDRYCRGVDPDVKESEIFKRIFAPLPEGVEMIEDSE